MASRMNRHRVSVAGQVTDGRTGRPLKGARVELTAFPVVFAAWMASRRVQYGDRWDELSERPDRRIAAADGLFYFVDLPTGSYTLGASLPDSGTRYGSAAATVTVPAPPANPIPPVTANLALAPTALQGQVRGPGGATVARAEVRMKGSGECTLSDDQGKYFLARLETGPRTVLVSAATFLPTALPTMLIQAGGVQTLDVDLTPAPQPGGLGPNP